MTASISPDLVSKTLEITTPPVVPPKTENAPVARIDFARVADDQIFVYGWILGLARSVQGAFIHVGGVAIDVVKQANRVRRPDIAQHFVLAAGDDEHGFCMLIDLPEKFSCPDHLRLAITLFSGQKAETHWPLPRQGPLLAPERDLYLDAFNRFLPFLPGAEAKRLTRFAIAQGVPLTPEFLPPPVRFGIDLCLVLEDRILLVSGWVFDPAKDLTLTQLHVGGSVFDLRKNSILIPRPEIDMDSGFYRKRDVPQNPGFIFIQELPPADRGVSEARFAFAAGADTVHQTRPISRLPQDTRRELLSLLGRMDPETVITLIEHLAPVLGKLSQEGSVAALIELLHFGATERLPPSIEHADPRYFLHIDHTIPVADKGIFLIGWFNADPGVLPRIECHCGLSTVAVSEKWIRHLRADVVSHLATLGIQTTDKEHGFTCYVPLSKDGAPYYLSAVLESGDVRRMQVSVPRNTGSAVETVRDLLTSFDSGHPDLRQLLERQIGPSVGAAWAARRRPFRRPVVHSYGTRPVNPSVSLIVPLYGRHDFAEYQMALFADDPEFQDVELIYVVDDPAIFPDFSLLCAHLHGIYQVPFVMAFAGANLGFAGANNFGAEIARGQYLLLLNSDVLPKRPKWVGDLLRVYKSLSSPGLIGAKLLYEDGSVQHAGMAFRRYSGWGDLWINDHPFKGQNPAGLDGVRAVDAVTAACAFVETRLYRDLGGLSEDYIIGDFEDSDLCLRATAAGRRNYVALDVELYHLERQSQGRMNNAMWRTNLTLYNCWLHNRRWAELIESTYRRNASTLPG